MNGTVGLTLQLATASTTLSGKLKLRAGEVLSVRIGKSLGGQRYEITLRGVRLAVRSSIPLPTGRLLQAKVYVSGRRIELKILEPAIPPGRPRPTAAIAMPAQRPAENDHSAILIQAMRRSGLPVTVASMSAITAMIPPSRRSNPAYVRLATLFYDKHLHVEPERLEELYLTINEGGHDDASGGSGSRRQSGDRTGGRNPARENAASHVAQTTSSTAADEPASTGGPAGPSDLPLRALLRQQLSAGSPEEIGWPALMNHPTGDHDSWIVVPFSVEVGETTVDGTIRLCISTPASRSLKTGARLPVSRAVVVVREIGAFEISGAPPRHVTIRPESEGVQARIAPVLSELKEKLRNLGVEIDDTNNGGAVFDGFSAETIEIRGVDATA